MPKGFAIILFLYFFAIPGSIQNIFKSEDRLIIINNIFILVLTGLILLAFKKKYSWGWKLLIVSAIFGILATLFSLVNIIFGNSLSSFSSNIKNAVLISKGLGLLFYIFIIYYSYKHRNYLVNS